MQQVGQDLPYNTSYVNYLLPLTCLVILERVRTIECTTVTLALRSRIGWIHDLGSDCGN
jgi:hypothetical protein